MAFEAMEPALRWFWGPLAPRETYVGWRGPPGLDTWFGFSPRYCKLVSPTPGFLIKGTLI